MVLRALALSFCSLFLSGIATGQCAPYFAPAGGRNGADQAVYCSALWDADGPGPAGARVVLAGGFSTIGNASAQSLATWDPTTGAFAGLPGVGYADVLAALGLPDGGLVVGGWLQQIQGVPQNGIARWNGSQWLPFGSGLGGLVYALLRLPNGDLVAAGAFTTAGGTGANRIARWNGSSWSPLGVGLDGPVYALALLPNGDVVAGGAFATAGGAPAQGIARWDGSSWSSLGGAAINTVTALCVRGNGDLVAVGTSVQRWDGSQWSSYALVLDGQVQAVVELANGDLVLGGFFTTANGQVARRVVRFDGVAWSAMVVGVEGGSGPGAYTLVALQNGDLVVGGRFTTAGTKAAGNVARFHIGTWHALGDGLDGSVRALAPLGGGSFAAGGTFLHAGDQTQNRIARWDGTAWQPIGAGLLSTCRALLRTGNGDLIVAGLSAALPNTYVARWSNGSWQALGGGIPGEVRCLAQLPNGDVVVGGQLNWAGFPVANIARWDGTAWHALGAGLGNRVNALAVLQNGDLVAGGLFTQRVARWDGASWQAVGAAGTEVHALAVLPNGDLVAGGDISGGAARTLQRWDGSSWQSFGANQSVYALAVHPSGALFAGGVFSVIGAVAVANLAMWDGGGWRSVAGAGEAFAGAVHALATLDDGSLAIGGEFTAIGASVGVNAVRRVMPCLYAVQTPATACVGPTGAIELRNAGVALRSGVLRCSARGFQPASLLLMASGYATANVPLAQLHPAGVAGCDQLTSPDDLVQVQPSAGTAALQILIPPAPALVGAVIHQQCLEIELQSGNLSAIRSSNRLTTTIGSL